MHFAALAQYQRHTMAPGSAMAFFGTQAKGVDVGVTSPGFARFGRMPRAGLQGLGDWFTDGMGAVTTQVTSIIGAVTGSSAQAEAQRNAVAIAQANAARDVESSRAFASAVPWVAGGLALVAAAVVFSRK